MSKAEAIHDSGWLVDRLKRHSHELIRLAWPVMLSRLGIVVLVIVDTIMVGIYSTDELAYLNLGNGTFIMVVLVMAIGFMMGTLIHTSHAIGAKDYAECGRIFRRSLPYSIWIGAIATILLLPGEFYFTLAGLTPELAFEGGKVMTVLAFGFLGHLTYVNGIFFLEGLGRPKPAMVIMVAGNILNVFLNYALIFGKFGFPEMGAVGSAWATTILRLLMGGFTIFYIFTSPSFKQYKLLQYKREAWASWKAQREKGLAAGCSLGVEVIAFAALTVFAGWIGKMALASYGVIFNIMTVPFMITAGLGASTAIRVGMAKGRGDVKDTALAAITGFGLGGGILLVSGTLVWGFDSEIFSAYTDDTALILFSLPFIAYTGLVIFFDGFQMIIGHALRGLGETWIPTGIQTFVYVVIMSPLSYYLAIPMGRGVLGLLEAVVYASVVSVALQGFHFYQKTRAAYPLIERT
ncbi:MAG: MATE family efflux transporter [Sphingomonadales bacterium]